MEEFLDTGHISEARRISASPRFQALSTFSSVYGIGPNTARKLHALGLQTLDDLEAYYGVDKEEVLQEGQIEASPGDKGHEDVERGPEEMERPYEKWWPGKGKDQERDTKGKKGSTSGGPMVGDAGSELGESWVRVALGLREDLALKSVYGSFYAFSRSRIARIPRDEVEEMGRVVMKELDDIEPGCTSTIVGG